MKNAHPIVNATAAASGPVGPDSTSLDEPAEPIIRLKVQKPLHWEWELTTSADALPVIQLLDKDGRLLVETTGRTAQRARGSFKEGLKSHEQFSVDESGTSSRGKTEETSSPSTSSASTRVPMTSQGNRNIDGFSSKFGTCNFAPRKSRSDINIKENRGSRKRHSSEDSISRKKKIERNVEEDAGLKKYLTGDYLRQQIMDDLRTRSTIGKTAEEIAKDRCRKVKAYLRSRSENLLRLVREEECSGTAEDRVEIESRGRNVGSRGLKRSDTVDSETKWNSRDKETMKPYPRIRSTVMSDEATTANSKTNQVDRAVQKIKDDMNEEELASIRAFLREKIQQRMNMEQTRSRSAVRVDVPKMPDSGNAGIKKRYSDYVHEGDRRNYRTRKVRSETSILRFDPEVLAKEKLKINKQSQREKLTTSCEKSSENAKLQRQLRNYRRSRSEVLTEAADDQPRQDDQSQAQLKEQSSNADKRKIYRKTRSDVYLGQAVAAAINADNGSRHLGNPPRRIKSQENVERSWREYKERKKSERLHRDSRKEVPEEDDFMSKPRWKDLQPELCSLRNCKVCQNLRNCVDPLYERDEKRITRQEAEAAPTAQRETAIKVPEDEISSTNSGSRPGTSLQENYLLVDEKNMNERRSPIAAKIHAKKRDDEISVPAFGVNSPDFGYNTIPPKSVFKDYRELYAHSNVKKSDTFKIVDGSEDPEKRADDCSSKINGDDGDLGYLNGVDSLANKSNEDITRDYFKRVYELLKKRQEEARNMVNGNHEAPGQGDSSSSNYVEEAQRKKHRRRKKDKSPPGKILR